MKVHKYSQIYHKLDEHSKETVGISDDNGTTWVEGHLLYWSTTVLHLCREDGRSFNGAYCGKHERPDGHRREAWVVNVDSNTLIRFYSPVDSVKEYADNVTKTVMNGIKKIGNAMKTLVDEKVQTLVKADYLNGDLELTDKGRAALDAIALKNHKDALVEMAQADIDEILKAEAKK